MIKVKNIVVDVIFYLAVAIFVLGIGGTLIAKNLGHDLYFFNYKPFLISSESMEPDFLVHSLVIIKKSNYETVRVGDIIAFKPEILNGKFALHRVIEQNETGLITKGDNNKIADLAPVTASEFVGQYVWHTNASAYVSQAIKRYGVGKAIAIPLMIVILALGAATLTVRAVFGKPKVNHVPPETKAPPEPEEQE
jgi:signal peptidase